MGSTGESRIASNGHRGISQTGCLPPPLSPSCPPQRVRTTSRNLSRSSGVIRLRRHPRPRGPPCPNPPNKMRHSSNSPSPCQNVIVRQPNSPGSSQFHSCITASPPMKTKAAINTGIRKNHFLLIFAPSFPKKLIVNSAQSLPQMQHCISLAR